MSYTEGNPIISIDADGSYTEVMIWDPVSGNLNMPIPFTDYFIGHSGFGHVSIDINGTTYTFGPKGMGTPSTTDFINSQTSFRGGLGRVLKLSPDQETLLAKELSNNKSAYNALNNNCVSPVQSGLKDVALMLERIYCRKILVKPWIKVIQFKITTFTRISHLQETKMVLKESIR